MHSRGINGEGELRGQPANPGSPGKWPLKKSVCVCVCVWSIIIIRINNNMKKSLNFKVSSSWVTLITSDSATTCTVATVMPLISRSDQGSP